MLEWTDPDLDDLLGSCLMPGQLVHLLEIHFSAAKQFIPISPSEAQMRSGLIGFCRKQDKLPSLLDEICARNETRFKEMAEQLEKRALQARFALPSNGLVTTPTLNNALFDRLTKINFVDEVVFFQELIKHEPRAALWICGSDVPARQALLYRLVNDLDEGQVNTGKARRKQARADYRNSYVDVYTIWREAGKEVDVVFDEAEVEDSKTKILAGICKCLRTQDFIIVLRNIEDALDDVEIKTSIVSFWQSVVKAGRVASHPARLLLFLVEERKAKSASGDSATLDSVDWESWVKGHDCVMPLRMNVIEQFPRDTIKFWYGTHAPHQIKTGNVGWHDLWKDAGEGQPQKIYGAACKCCNEHPSNFDTWLRQL